MGGERLWEERGYGRRGVMGGEGLGQEGKGGWEREEGRGVCIGGGDKGGFWGGEFSEGGI